MEKLDGALETTRVHHVLPDHIAQILNLPIAELLNSRNVFFVYPDRLKFGRKHAPAFAETNDMEKSAPCHRFQSSRFARPPGTGTRFRRPEPPG